MFYTDFLKRPKINENWPGIYHSWLRDSRAVWPDGYNFFHYLATYNKSNLPKFNNNLPKWSIFSQTLNIPTKVCIRFLKVCPRGKISPNLVTLLQSDIEYVLTSGWLEWCRSPHQLLHVEDERGGGPDRDWEGHRQVVQAPHQTHQGLWPKRR